MATIISSFKSNHFFEERKAHACALRMARPDKIPVVVQINEITETRYPINDVFMVRHLMYLLRKDIRLNLTDEDDLAVFVAGIRQPSEAMISSIYKKHKDEDGFLYVMITVSKRSDRPDPDPYSFESGLQLFAEDVAKSFPLKAIKSTIRFFFKSKNQVRIGYLIQRSKKGTTVRT